MKVSELVGLLSKVQQFASDVDVVLKAAENEAETVISDLAIHIAPDGTTGGTLEITHGTAPPAAEGQQAQPAGQDQAQQGGDGTAQPA